jgi:hypothetical protein
MAAILPKVFNTGASKASSSYDWYDFASGAAYKKFYLAAGKTSAGGSYFLTDSTDIGSASDTDAAGSTYELRLDAATTADRDFDLTFNTPHVIAGTAYISGRLTCFGDIARTANIKVTIYHVTSGGTETSLGSVTGPTRTGTPVNTKECFAIPLTQKSFAKGEKLRVTLELTTNGNYATVYHDPSGRSTATDSMNGGTLNSQFIVMVPFRVSL